MAKDPAFLFYPNDYIGGTMGMTFEEKGAYMELLMMQFNRGHMTSHMVGQTIGQLWDNIQDKFIQDEKGLWYNERLQIEKEKRKTYTKSRRNNLEGVNQYTKKEPKKLGHKIGHMTSHMENENENENKDRNGNTKSKILFSDAVEIYGYCQKVTSANDLWNTLHYDTQVKIMDHINIYIENHKDHKKESFLPDFYNYLNDKRYLATSLPYKSEKGKMAW